MVPGSSWQSEAAKSTSSAAAARAASRLGAPKRRVDVSGQGLDRVVPLRRGRVGDDDEGREAEGVDADETGPEGGTRLAGECCHVRVDEQEGAGHRPFARLRGAREHEGVGRVEADGTRQHEHGQSLGAPACRSSQAGRESRHQRQPQHRLRLAADDEIAVVVEPPLSAGSVRRAR